jgi:hypothetical protein
MKKHLWLFVGLIFILLVASFFITKSLFAAPRKDAPLVKYRVSQTSLQRAVVGDLKYYDFIKHESALKLALLIGSKTSRKEIQRSSIYEISQSMNVWQIANILLNNGTPIDCSHGCPDSNFDPELLPGGDLAPTLKEKYSWVKTYEDCTKAIGHDGGQLSSEQYAQRTGIRRCVAPDGREFTQGKEGWLEIPTP